MKHTLLLYYHPLFSFFCLTYFPPVRAAPHGFYHSAISSDKQKEAFTATINRYTLSHTYASVNIVLKIIQYTIQYNLWQYLPSSDILISWKSQ